MGVVEETVINARRGAADAIDDRVFVRRDFRVGIDCQRVGYGENTGRQDQQDIATVQSFLDGFGLVCDTVGNRQDDFLHTIILLFG